MSLQGVPFWRVPLNAQVAPTSGHPCLMQGNSCDIQTYARTQEQLRLRLLFVVRHWHCACILILQRGGRHLVAETDSAANQFGAPESVETRAAHFRCLWPASAPRVFSQTSG